MRYIVLFLLSFNLYAKDITAQSWLVTNEEGYVIAGERVTDVRPIASITKLITAMTIINGGQNLDEVVKTKPFGPITRRQLMDMAIVKSNNQAADLLCQLYIGGYDMCIADMNHLLFKLNLLNTIVYDSTGLDRRNVSTAMELSKLLQEASKYPELVNASHQVQIKIKTKKRFWVFHNTNPLIGKRQDIIISKTGYTKPAGGCLAMLMSTDKGQRTVVVLGSQNTHTRIPEAEFLAENY
jgi:D-alanyl-D-alanine endopeptidase (penicillin-binding protein 7)